MVSASPHAWLHKKIQTISSTGEDMENMKYQELSSIIQGLWKSVWQYLPKLNIHTLITQ